MKHISVYLLFALAVQSLCCADVTKLAPEDRIALESTSRFHEVYSTGDLPSAVVALCGGGKIAEPGQKWNATDAMIDPTLPGKRLIWAAGEAKPILLWSAVGCPFKKYAALLEAFRSGKLADRLDYAHLSGGAAIEAQL